MLKKVLIISYQLLSFHQPNLRIQGLAKFLPEFGWQPIILTPQQSMKPNPQFKVIETPYHDPLHFWRKLLRLSSSEDISSQIKNRYGITSKKSLIDFILKCAGEVITYPDSAKGWYSFAVDAGIKSRPFKR